MNLRKSLMAVIALTALAGCDRKEAARPAAPAQQEARATAGTIVAVGDSLTAGYGLDEHDAYPAQLERRLQETGHPWRVVNAGISGETSSGALSRVNWVLTLKPDIVILVTGANDGLRGIDPKVTEKNIDEMVRTLKERNVTVVLGGMKMVANLGRDYTRAFAAVYPAVAKRHDLILVPFFLKGVAGRPELNQADGIHPTAEGYRIVSDTVLPYVIKAIEQTPPSGG
ncbi:arylesterase [Geobacter sulfurreducens]|uniref:arylesterase n=1 Tax=Geobacter sulfurreducens TaxID=35554 RepID=UPI0020B712D3|nr:arylesterase [Geobacter sulfurreducens]UTG91770.1 arylesterase [Geobacter sulfurreducens]